MFVKGKTIDNIVQVENAVWLTFTDGEQLCLAPYQTTYGTIIVTPYNANGIVKQSKIIKEEYNKKCLYLNQAARKKLQLTPSYKHWPKNYKPIRDGQKIKIGDVAVTNINTVTPVPENLIGKYWCDGYPLHPIWVLREIPSQKKEK